MRRHLGNRPTWPRTHLPTVCSHAKLLLSVLAACIAAALQRSAHRRLNLTLLVAACASDGHEYREDSGSHWSETTRGSSVRRQACSAAQRTADDVSSEDDRQHH